MAMNDTIYNLFSNLSFTPMATLYVLSLTENLERYIYGKYVATVRLLDKLSS